MPDYNQHNQDAEASHLNVDFKVKLLVCLVAVLAGISVGFVGCETPQPRVKSFKDKMPGEPLIRVRLKRGTDQVTITAPKTIQVFAGQSDRPRLISTPVTFKLANGQWRAVSGETTTFVQNDLRVESVGPGSLGVNKVFYPGKIVLNPSLTSRTPQTFDVVNHVRLEAYLPGVLDQELYDDWSSATFLSQAIAARTYAIDRIINFGPGKHYDVEAGQASQAYIGSSTHQLAIRSVIDTMGMVLTYDQQIFPAFYSSTCGGVAQSADVAFEKKYPRPLNIVGKHNWCMHTRHYNWDTIKRSRYSLTRRINAWGMSRRDPIAKMGTLQAIYVFKRNRYNRPEVFTLIDVSGKRYQLNAESFRHACNYSASRLGMKSVTSKERLKSSFVEIKREGSYFLFTNGHGFGHGVGMCQYGAENMARLGKSVNDILTEYYPEATVERAY